MAWLHPQLLCPGAESISRCLHSAQVVVPTVQQGPVNACLLCTGAQRTDLLQGGLELILCTVSKDRQKRTMVVKWRAVAILTLKWSLCNSQRIGEISDRAVRGSPVGNQQHLH